MSYERHLTFNLRLRGLSEPEIAEAIDKARAHEAATGNPAKAEFGTAEEYARQFPKKKRRTRGSTIATIGGALAITYALSTVVLMLFGVDVREYVGPITFLPGLVLIVVGILVGFLTDYFQPAAQSSSAG